MGVAERPLEAARLPRVHLIEPLGHLRVLVFGKELGDRGCIELTARHPEALGQGIGRFKELVGEGDSGFHTGSIPWYYRWRKQLNATLEVNW